MNLRSLAEKNLLDRVRKMKGKDFKEFDPFGEEDWNN